MTVTRSKPADGLDDQTPAEVTLLKGRLRRLQVTAIALALVVLIGAVAGGVIMWSRSSAPSQNSPNVGFARDMYTHHNQAVTMALMMRNTVPEPFNTLTLDIVTSQAVQQGVMLGWLQKRHLVAAGDDWKPMAWMAGTSGMDSMSAHGRVAVTPTAAAATPGSSPTPTPTVTSVVGWGVMPGMATDAELTRLAELKGKEREVLFLRLMVRHHRAGADMARTYLQLGSDPQLRELARSVVSSQEREIGIMTDLLADRGATEAVQ